ncbi:MAG: FIST signal transduction protein [Elusimicrobiota bacterium]
METKFSTALVKEKDSYRAGVKAAKKAMKKSGIKRANFSLVFASSSYDYKEVVRGVRDATRGAPLIGCSSSGEFTEEKVQTESVACAVMASENYKFFTGLGKGLRENELGALKQASSVFPLNVEGYPYLSGVLLADGLAGKGEASVMAALNTLGTNIKLAGGTAGDDFKFKESVVFMDDEVSSDAVSLALLASRTPVAIGVKHGHTPISPPLTITKARENTVHEINNRPAFEVWKEYTREKAAEIGIDVDNMKDEEEIVYFFTRYEAGVLTGAQSDEYRIRWPGVSPNTEGSMTFSTSVSEGMVIRVMESPRESQIESAKRAAKIALEACGSAPVAGAVIFDCACRALILKDEFSKAVEEIKKVLNVPFIGFETYGEIAMEIGQLSGFHNTTTVVLLLPA